ncbi:hypothetical protein [Rickettsia endosymbiont of Orchestes rusci]|uniref:hypothetical protein n=1 Tax=Rickettsia endosymbiont of Orchestes rusci TaxID=3066250 RepID=UPI00313C427C
MSFSQSISVVAWIPKPSLRSHEVAAAIQTIPNYIRDLSLTRLPRRHKCLLAMTFEVSMQQCWLDHGMTISLTSKRNLIQ